MPIEDGTHELGPGNATLSVRTGRTGAAAKAGHDLLLEVSAWRGTLELRGESGSVALDVDPTSLRVREGMGGMQALDDGDKANIEQTIDAEVLKGEPIRFRSSAVRVDGDRIAVEGELTLGGATRPLAFALTLGAGGELGGSVVVKQTDWVMQLYSTLFGTLRVADEVEVVLAAVVDQSR